jgi:hypothetical protein
MSAKKTKETLFFRKDGESIPVVVPREPRKQRGPMYSYIGGFVVLSIDGLRQLARMRLQGGTLRVLLCVLEHLSGNVVYKLPTSTIAGRLGVVDSAVSRSLMQLEEAGIVRRGPVRGVITLNPHYGFLGSAVAQRSAVKEWDANNRPVPVPSEVA